VKALFLCLLSCLLTSGCSGITVSFVRTAPDTTASKDIGVVVRRIECKTFAQATGGWTSARAEKLESLQLLWDGKPLDLSTPASGDEWKGDWNFGYREWAAKVPRARLRHTMLLLINNRDHEIRVPEDASNVLIVEDPIPQSQVGGGFLKRWLGECRMGCLATWGGCLSVTFQ
jgi:hypothetical protein